MATIFQVIFAVCCFIEVISARTISSNDTKIELQVFLLNMSLSDVCGPIKASSKECRVPKIKPLNSQENKSEMCSSYKRVFGEVSCALTNISPRDCIIHDKIKSVQKHASVLSHNVTCSDREKIMMTKFCSELQIYIDRFSATCL